MNNTLTPIYDNTQLPKIGGFWRLRLAYSKEVVQQLLQTQNELEQCVFFGDENWITNWELADNMSADLKIDYTYNEYRGEEKHSFKAILEVDANPQDFQRWFTKYIKGRKLVVELTNNNGFVRYLNPYYLSYIYTGDGSLSTSAKFELNFTKATVSDYEVKLINDIELKHNKYKKNSGEEINLLNAIVQTVGSPERYDFLQARVNDITKAAINNTNVLILEEQDEYFLFVRVKGTNVYQTAYINYNNNTDTDYTLIE